MTLPQYYSIVEEFSAPWNVIGNPVYQVGLRLKQIEKHITPCPFAQAFKEHQDAERFEQEYIPKMRSCNENIFFGTLDRQRPLEERQTIIHEYYQTYQNQVQESPEMYRMDYMHAFTII